MNIWERLAVALAFVIALVVWSNADQISTSGPGASSPGGIAGGDLSGTFPSPTVAKINGTTPGTGVVTALGTNVGSAGAFVTNGGALGTPSSGTLTNATGLPNGGLVNSTISLNGASTALGGSYSAATVNSGAKNPAGTTSASRVMMGMAVAFTPTSSGRALFGAYGVWVNNTAADGCQFLLLQGTGTAPVNGATETGASVGGPIQQGTYSVGNSVQPFSMQGVVTGMAVSTARWIDMSAAAVTGGTCTLQNINVWAIEQ